MFHSNEETQIIVSEVSLCALGTGQLRGNWMPAAGVVDSESEDWV